MWRSRWFPERYREGWQPRRTGSEKNIADVLEMTVDDAVIFFEEERTIIYKLKPLQEVGLGYVRLGQSATTLSGGEYFRALVTRLVMICSIRVASPSIQP